MVKLIKDLIGLTIKDFTDNFESKIVTEEAYMCNWRASLDNLSIIPNVVTILHDWNRRIEILGWWQILYKQEGISLRTFGKAKLRLFYIIFRHLGMGCHSGPCPFPPSWPKWKAFTLVNPCLKTWPLGLGEKSKVEIKTRQKQPFGGHRKWHFGCPNQNSKTTFQYNLAPKTPKKPSQEPKSDLEKWFLAIFYFAYFWVICPLARTIFFECKIWTEGALKSKSWRKQTSFKIKFPI